MGLSNGPRVARCCRHDPPPLLPPRRFRPVPCRLRGPLPGAGRGQAQGAGKGALSHPRAQGGARRTPVARQEHRGAVERRFRQRVRAGRSGGGHHRCHQEAGERQRGQRLLPRFLLPSGAGRRRERQRYARRAQRRPPHQAPERRLGLRHPVRRLHPDQQPRRHRRGQDFRQAQGWSHVSRQADRLR